MTIYSKPITLSDISKITGVKSKSLGYMVQNGSYNEKAACKPVDVDSYHALTMEERKTVNYGTYIQQFNNPIQLARAVADGTAWRYVKPTHQTRMLDFDGYNSEAGDWMTTITRESNSSMQVSLSLEFEGNGDALSAYSPLLSLLELGFLQEYELRQVNFGYLFREDGFSSDMTSCYYIPLTGAQDIREFAYRIPANTFPRKGVWHLMPVLTLNGNDTYPQGERVYFSNQTSTLGTWWPIPYSNIISINITEPTYPVDLFSAELYSKEASIDTAFKVTVTSLMLSITNNNDTAYDAKVKVVPTPLQMVSNTMYGSFVERTINVGAGQTVNVEMVSSAVSWEVFISAYVDVILTVEAKQKTIGSLLVVAGRG